MSLFIGVMSGTSVDAIDVALVDVSAESKPKLLAATAMPFNPTVKSLINEFIEESNISLLRLGDLHRTLGEYYAKTINEFLAGQNISADKIQAIGCHGQTICHAPLAQRPFSIQVGDPSTIAELTGITTITDFRQRDMVCGGQGAPLVPAFHQAIFQSNTQNRIIVNIGGISNITRLWSDIQLPVIGFDTGPGNILMDSWTQLHFDQPYDKNGDIAFQGQVDDSLLNCLLEDPYFRADIPKSTGREYFNLPWLNERLIQIGKPIDPITVQNTLAHLTAHSISDAIKKYVPAAEDYAVYICGGGAHNRYLIHLLSTLLSPAKVSCTDQLGFPTDYVEACAFAWLAYRTLNKMSGNIPSVTGAIGERVLGGIYPA